MLVVFIILMCGCAVESEVIYTEAVVVFLSPPQPIFFVVIQVYQVCGGMEPQPGYCEAHSAEGIST